MKKIAVFLIVCLTVFAGAGMAFHPALGKPFDGYATSDNYAVKFPGLIFDGVYHITEVPYSLLHGPYTDIVTEKQYVTGLFTGLYKGTMGGLGHIYEGTFDILTSFIPGQKGMHGHNG